MAGPWEQYAQPTGPWSQYQAPVPLSAGDTAVDVAKSGGIGLAKGAIGLAGMPGDLGSLISSGYDKATNALGINPDTAQTVKSVAGHLAPAVPFLGAVAQGPTSHDIQSTIEGATGPLYKPQTVPGEYAQTIGEFAPAVLGGPESLAAKVGTRVLAPAIASETAGQVSKGTPYEPYMRAVGAVMSPAVLSGAKRIITPLPATAERAALASTLANEGVDLTAGQRTGSKPLQWAESTFGDMPGAGGRPAQIMTNQQEQFTNAALWRVGEDAPRATPEVIDNAFNRIGGQFDAIGARNKVVPDQQFVNDLISTRDEYHNLVGPSARAPVVENTIGDIAQQIQKNGGTLTGEQYNALTSRLGRQARATPDPILKSSLQGLKENLDDAFERSLQASGNTQDLAVLKEARNQYRNLMVVEKAATGAGSNAAEGLISPSQLRNAVVQQNRRSYARGQGDFADLARSGEAVMKPLPNSGTAPRQYMQHIMSLMSAGLGGATAGLPGMMAGIAAPSMVGRLLMSRPGQAYLGNQLMTGDIPKNFALINALLAGGPANAALNLPRQ